MGVEVDVPPARHEEDIEVGGEGAEHKRGATARSKRDSPVKSSDESAEQRVRDRIHD
jgi:hypothetical protein